MKPLISISLIIICNLIYAQDYSVDTTAYGFKVQSVSAAEDATNKFRANLSLNVYFWGKISLDLFGYSFNYHDYILNENTKFKIEYYKQNDKGKFKKLAKNKVFVNDNEFIIKQAHFPRLFNLPEYYKVEIDSIYQSPYNKRLNKKEETLFEEYQGKYDYYIKNEDTIIESRHRYGNFYKDTTSYYRKLSYSNNQKSITRINVVKNAKTNEIDTSVNEYKTIHYINKSYSVDSIYTVKNGDTTYNRCTEYRYVFDENDLIVEKYEINFSGNIINYWVYEYDKKNRLVIEKYFTFHDSEMYTYRINTFVNGIWKSSLIQSCCHSTEFYIRK